MVHSKKGMIGGGNTQPIHKGVMLNRSSGGNSGAFFNFILHDVFND
jgi:hypothetical protein